MKSIEPKQYLSCAFKRHQAGLLPLSILLSALSPQVLFAAPSVEGVTITVPDNDWYQVQRSDNYATICQGVISCVVEEGSYIVVNLTTGQRFENIVVGSPAAQGGNGSVTVSGNIISWPDDGWYQVQDGESYKTVCEGGLSCAVVPGQYNVINLTLNNRYENITVGDSGTGTGTGSGSGEVAVSGSTIVWPDNGWYQVQRADTYAEVCQGGLSCEVEAGAYNVINLTNGTRYDNIVVGESLPPADTTLLDVGQELLVSMAGYQLDDLAKVVEDLAIDITTGLSGTELPAADFRTDVYLGGTVVVAIESVRYNCELGGTVTHNVGESVVSGNFTLYRALNLNWYTFDQCNHANVGSAQPGGNYLLQGQLYTKEYSRSGSGVSSSTAFKQWDDFSLTTPSNIVYEVQGSTDRLNTNDQNVTNLATRDTSITHYREKNNEQMVESISASSYNVSKTTHPFGLNESFQLIVNGFISGQDIGGQTIEIISNPNLNRLWVAAPSAGTSEPFSGQIDFYSDDGGSLYLTAVPEEVLYAPLVSYPIDLSFTSASGEKFDRTDVALDIALFTSVR